MNVHNLLPFHLLHVIPYQVCWWRRLVFSCRLVRSDQKSLSNSPVETHPQEQLLPGSLPGVERDYHKTVTWPQIYEFERNVFFAAEHVHVLCQLLAGPLALASCTIGLGSCIPRGSRPCLVLVWKVFGCFFSAEREQLPEIEVIGRLWAMPAGCLSLLRFQAWQSVVGGCGLLVAIGGSTTD